MRLGSIAVLALACALPCHPEDGRVTAHDVIAVDGQYIDFEHATVLSEAQVGGLQADVQVLRVNHSTVVLRPIGDARAARIGGEALDEERLQAAPAAGDCNLAPEDGDSPVAFAARTRTGQRLRGRVAFANAAGVPELIAFSYELQHDGSDRFPSPVSDLRARYSVRGVEVAWDAGAAEKVLLRWWTDGDVAHEEVVEGDAKIVEGLTPGKCYRVEAATLTEGGAGVPSRTSVFTADVGVKRGRIRSDHDPGHGYSVSFRAGGFDEADPDWVPFFWGMRVPPGGGILRLGEGQRLFDETTRLPTRGYVPAYHRFDEGDVLAIRLADGRYVKVLIRPEVRDVRDELVLDYVFLAMGGREEPEGPTRLTGEPQADGLHLSWIGCEGAATYKVVEWGAEQRVVTTVRETSAVIPDTVRNRFYDLAVIASTASGAEMGACHARIGTWYPWWSIGEVELDWHTTNGYDFSAGTSRQGAGDFWITRSAGGMSSLELTAKSGICEEGIPEVEGKTEIELLEALDGLAWVDKIQADGRSPANGRFAVKTAAGRYAIVRLGDRTSNGRRFEYVYLLPLTDVEEMGRQLTERGGAVDPETLAALRSLLPRLDSDDPAVRDEASLAVEALPREAVLAIAALLREGGLSAEARARLSEAAATLYRKPAR